MAKNQANFPTSLDTLNVDRVAGQIVTSDSYDIIETAITEIEKVVPRKIKTDATVAPAVTNDTTEGYAVNSLWIDVTNDKAYICVDATDGAAVWIEITSQGVGDALTTDPLSQFAATTSAQLAGVISDEIGTGKLRFDTSVTAKTTTATLTVAEAGTILVSASSAYTITLPTPVDNVGLTYKVKKTDFNYNLITFATTAGQFNYENADSALKDTYPRLNTGGAEATFVSDGANWQVINEALGQVPRCRVYLSTNQLNIAHRTYTTVLFDTESYDIGSNFNTTTHKFIVPVAGKYECIGKLDWKNRSIPADTEVATYIYSFFKNWQHSSTDMFFGGMAMGISSFAVDDEIYLQTYTNQDTDTADLYAAADATQLIIRLISKD